MVLCLCLACCRLIPVSVVDGGVCATPCWLSPASIVEYSSPPLSPSSIHVLTVAIWHGAMNLWHDSAASRSVPGLTLSTAHLRSARQAEIARITVSATHDRLLSILTLEPYCATLRVSSCVVTYYRAHFPPQKDEARTDAIFTEFDLDFCKNYCTKTFLWAVLNPRFMNSQ